MECGGYAHGDKHHARDRAYSEHKKVSHRPVRIADGRENKQCDGGGPGKSVDQSDDEWAHIPVEATRAQKAIHPRNRHLGGIIGVRMTMRVRVRVHYAAMAVSMRVHDLRRIDLGGPGHGAQKAGDVDHPENDEHHRDGKFHAEADAHRNNEVEENYSGSDHENRGRVAKAPECTDQCGASAAAMVGNDGGDRDDVVRIGGVTHAEKKSDGENGEKSDHRCGL